jgi:recombination protein RecT
MPQQTPKTVRDAAAARAAAVPAVVTRTDAIAQIVTKNRHVIAASLPSGMSEERFGRLLLTASATNPALMSCDPRSFLAAGVTAAQLGLEPNDPRGLAYLIPFGNKVQLIIGYRGYLDLARRSGQVGAVNAYPVFEGDTFTYELGLQPTLTHVPDPDGDENPDTLTHVYAIARVNGEPQFVVLTRKQVDRARAVSKTGDRRDSPWSTYYVEMALKTAIRRLCKYLPQTVELAHAQTVEDTPLSLGDLSAAAGFTTVQEDDEDVLDAEEVSQDEIEAAQSDELAAPDGYTYDPDQDEPEPAA